MKDKTQKYHYGIQNGAMDFNIPYRIMIIYIYWSKSIDLAIYITTRSIDIAISIDLEIAA